MRFGVPVIAREAAAIPETLGSAGVLFTQLGYVEVAEMAHLLATDPDLRAQVVSTERNRLRMFAPDKVEARLRTLLDRIGVL
jgi:hypothetical protein